MGLFTKENCALCGNKAGLLKTTIKDNQKLCSNCQAKLDMDISMLPYQSIDDIKEHIEFRKNNQIDFNAFKITREVKTITTSFYIDDEKKQWYTGNKKVTNPTIFSFSDIIDYEITEDGETVTKGGLGNAVAGGILFGATGAVVGGVTGKKTSKTVIKNMNLRISLKHKYKTSLNIPLIPIGTECKVGSMTYDNVKQIANNITSLLDNMCSQSAEPTPTNIVVENTTSSADEIRKFKELLDEGVITQEEFDAKKKQLLGL